MIFIKKLGATAAALFLLSVSSLSETTVQSAGEPTTQPQPHTTQDKASTPKNIPIINPLSTSQIGGESTFMAVSSKEKDTERGLYSTSEWWLVYLTGTLAAITGALAWYTGRLYRATVKLGVDAEKSGLEQGKKMEASIEQAGRSAIAMEDVAKSMKINADKIVESVDVSKSIGENQKLYSEMQMRAYVSVDIGSAFPQNTATGFRFEAGPILINNGMTPARNFCYVIKAGILPVPLSDDFDTKLEIPQDAAKGLIPPRQTRFIRAVVEHLVPEDEVQGIMDGLGQSLYVWGAFAYDDVFGVHRKNEFCHRIAFSSNREGVGFTINGVFEGNRNKET